MEFLVQQSTAPALFLLSGKFILIAIIDSASAVTRLVKAGIRHLAVELDILGLLFANHDGVLEVDVQKDEKLSITGLEEQMLNIRKQNI